MNIGTKQPSYQAILFDLDGTITNPAKGIINSILYAAKAHQYEEKDIKSLYSFIGPPLHHSFQQRYQTTAQQAKEMVKSYRVYYGKKGIFECGLYPGITELMQYLHQHNIYIALATSKPIFYAQQLLQHFKLTFYISFVGGANMDGSRTDKKEVIDYTLSHIPQFARKSILMLGDTKFDIEGAQHFGLDSAWAAWGYGSKAEIEKLKPTYSFQTAIDVLQLF